jgi:nitrate/nitrite transport system substrate-binding protein
MSNQFDAFDADRPLMLRCACGQDHAPGEHAAVQTEQSLSQSFMEATMVKALFARRIGGDGTRQRAA